MPELNHLLVVVFTSDRPFKSNQSVRKVYSPQRDRGAHGHRLLRQLAAVACRCTRGIRQNLCGDAGHACHIFSPPSRRGWQSKFRYQSRGLHFAVKGATKDKECLPNGSTSSNVMKLMTLMKTSAKCGEIGSQLRSRDSIHNDVWSGTAAQLREKSQIVVFLVGEWWKDLGEAERAGKSVGGIASRCG